MMEGIFFILFGYLSGSILFGYWIPKKWKQKDVCLLSEDGNPGTANAFLYAGNACGSLVLLCELSKGFFPVFFAMHNVQNPNFLTVALILAAPVAGHAFPIYTKGKNGGKGIAVSFGVLLGLYPRLETVFVLAFWYLLFSIVWIVRPHCLRTALTYILWTVSMFFSNRNKMILPGIFLISTIVIQKHMYSLKKMKKEETQIQFLFRRS